MAALRTLVVEEGTLGEGGLLTLDADLAKYVRDVLRLRPETNVRLTDGAGVSATGRILRVTKTTVEVLVEGVSTRLPESDETDDSVVLTLFQGLAKGEKMDRVVRQVTELGARVIAPVLSERSVPKSEGRVDRWRAIAEDAMRVSGRLRRPIIQPAQPLIDVLERERDDNTLALCLSPMGSESLRSVLRQQSVLPRRIELLVGPEGGLSEAELALAESHGFRLVGLGAHVLRTETAGPAAVAIVLFHAGVLGG